MDREQKIKLLRDTLTDFIREHGGPQSGNTTAWCDDRDEATFDAVAAALVAEWREEREHAADAAASERAALVAEHAAKLARLREALRPFALFSRTDRGLLLDSEFDICLTCAADFLREASHDENCDQIVAGQVLLATTPPAAPRTEEGEP